MESILTSIKNDIGVMPEYTIYDGPIITHINTALFALTQIGVGPEDGFVITDDQSKWSDFLGDSKQFEPAKSYVYAKTKLAFDPPSSAVHIEALNKLAEESLGRLSILVETEV